MDITSGDTFSTINKNDSQKRAEEDDSEIDHLTHLPDPILFLILSFLPFKQWILMRLVSKTFKNLWTHAPVLDFQAPKSRFTGHMTCHCCGAFHGHVLPVECYFYYIELPRERFCRFVSRTLVEHSGYTIKVFRLALNYHHHSWGESMLKRWVDFMFTKDIENLDVNFDESNSFEYHESTGLRVMQVNTSYLYFLPPQNFISKMLSAMSLQYCQFSTSGFGTFESLKYLCLRNVVLLDNQITNFLSKFPMMLSLVVEKCVFGEDFFVSNEVLTIKYLYIFDCMTSTWLTYNVDVITPQIMEFHFKGVGLQEFHIRNANELQSVQIDIDCADASQEAGVRLSSLLNSLHHCAKLVLSSWCIQVLSRWRSGSEYLLQFHSVRNLELILNFVKEEFPGIYYLLQCCSNLKTLTISIDMFNLPESVIPPELWPEIYDFPENNFWETHDSAVTCLQYSVNTVTIYGFSGRAVEVEFLKFLLRNGQALEKIYIQEFKGEQGDSVSDEWWVSNVAHIYNNRIANAVQFASTSVQVIIK
ncbi:F-box/LRR-repeat protein [Artemisia annua]|uniref:F-box/LRR-repeat protein n=1 Tax=Artemisia annua TaxID=35608 RepID=A0A2U1L7M6_ARTAN|nr:F-box/LRR-repeat protein [Artemisia annua]